MSKRTRRQFLEDSMFAAAAAVTAGSTTALAAQDQASTSPNEKLGVAIVGCGGRGGSHLNAFSGRPDTEVLYVVDVDDKHAAGKALAAKKKQGRTPKIVRDMRAAFDDPSVDIVTTATPNHWHALTSIWAMQAGKDMYVEKPVSHNVSEGRRAVETARKYGRICQTGTQCRSNPGMQEAMKYAHDGGIGKIKVARGLCYKRRPSIGKRGEYDVPAGVDYNLWLGPAPLAPLTRPRFHYDWHWQWPYGNGDLGNQGIHQMDLCRWALGADRLSDWVLSYGGRLGYTDAGDTANTQVVMHGYGDQALVFEVRGLKTTPYKGANVGIILEGTDGYLVMTSYDKGAAFDKDGNKVQEFKGGGDHYGNFITAVRNRIYTDLNADIEEGHLSSALCHLGNVSYRLGEQLTVPAVKERLRSVETPAPVAETFQRVTDHLAANKLDLEKTELGWGAHLKINTENETFIDNPQADKMLTREYRAPFIVPPAGQV